MAQVFIAISTRQNVANLPPILEQFQPGDEVVWLEGKQGESEARSEGIVQILQKRKIPLRSYALDRMHDPTSILNQLPRAIEPHLTQGIPILVANGGKKASLLAIWEVLRRYHPRVVYNMKHPCGYLEWRYDADATSVFHRYQRHDLDLQDILAAYGFRVVSLQRLWPDFQNPPDGSPPRSLAPGYRLEQVAARCTKNWLERATLAHVCQSAWTRVVVNGGKTQQNMCELDVVLVLKNGVVVAIECKSGSKSLAEIDKHFERIRRVVSRTAVIALCASYDFNSKGEKRKLDHDAQLWDGKKRPLLLPIVYSNNKIATDLFEINIQKLLAPYLSDNSVRE